MTDFSYETQFGRSDGKIICGVDEVGRGPLAGPVMAAAVILPLDISTALLTKIKDSKKLSALQREALFDPLRSCCQFAIAEANMDEILKYNILGASMLAMSRAVASLKTKIDMALIDGNRIPKSLPCKATPIIKGDNLSLSIAAASILAKVTRDRFMQKLAIQYPGYGWEHNAGYGTREHMEALNLLGTTLWHRDSFAPIAELKRKALERCA